MDKINNVSFTGITNIGYIKFKRPTELPNVKINSKSISMILLDDYKGNDLTEYLNVIKRMPKTQYGYLHPAGHNALNIECASLEDCNLLLVNGRPIKVDDEHLPMFSYIAKLTRTITNMKDTDMVVNKTYKDYAADSLLVFGDKVSKLPESTYSKDAIDYFLLGNVVRNGAKKVNSFIQNLMNDYFGV